MLRFLWRRERRRIWGEADGRGRNCVVTVCVLVWDRWRQIKYWYKWTELVVIFSIFYCSFQFSWYNSHTHLHTQPFNQSPLSFKHWHANQFIHYKVFHTKSWSLCTITLLYNIPFSFWHQCFFLTLRITDKRHLIVQGTKYYIIK